MAHSVKINKTVNDFVMNWEGTRVINCGGTFDTKKQLL